MFKIEIESKIKGNLTELSNTILTMQGVNYELFPLIKMTAPTSWSSQHISQWPVGRELFSSTLLLFLIIPVDLHKFKLIGVSDSGFSELSSSLINKQWRHTRIISQQGLGCSINDVVEYIPKLSFMRYLAKPFYILIFHHRHKRLKALYGEIY